LIKVNPALEHLGETPQGIFVLHHGIFAYPQWPAWDQIVGIKDPRFGYQIGGNAHVEVADPRHPITRGMRAWDMIDKTYTMADAGGGSHVLLATNHPPGG